MVYVLALIAAVTVAVLLWKAFGPGSRAGLGRPSRPVLAPDDDPEFLRRIGNENRPDEDPPTR